MGFDEFAARIYEVERRLRLAQDAMYDVQAGLAASNAQLYNTGGGTGGGSGGSPVSCPAVTGGGGVPALSGGVAGSAVVTLYDIDPSSGATTSLVTVTAWNFFPNAVGAGKSIYVTWFVNSAGQGMWVVPSESC